MHVHMSVFGHTFSILYFSMSVPYLGISWSLNTCQFTQSGELSPILLGLDIYILESFYMWTNLRQNWSWTRKSKTLFIIPKKIELLHIFTPSFLGYFYASVPSSILPALISLAENAPSKPTSFEWADIRDGRQSSTPRVRSHARFSL